MKRILIVDDSKLIRLQLHATLVEEGFLVHEASNLYQAKNDAFSSEASLDQIDLVLLDIYLHGENGLDLLEHLTREYPQIPVIIISGDNKRETVIRSVQLGARDYIIKPFDRNNLIRKVISYISPAAAHEAERSVHESHGENRQRLELAVSMEISRTIRSKLAFSLVRLDLDPSFDAEKSRSVRDVLTYSIRDIDQVYLLDNQCIVLVLPLTDAQGAAILAKRIKETVGSAGTKLKMKATTFPSAAQDLDSIRLTDEREKIIRGLGLVL